MRSVDELPPISAGTIKLVHYEDAASVEMELVPAREIIADSETVYSKVMDEVQSGQDLDSRAVKKIVHTMVDSVIRNPDALTWLVRLKSRDEYTYSHSIAVCVLAITLGRQLGLPEDELNKLGLSTLLQDIGKLRLPTPMLEKPAALTKNEYKLAQKHVHFSVDILQQKSKLPDSVIQTVLLHHERFDGSGYPFGLKGDKIDLHASIAGIVDTYDAMTNDKAYRKAMTSFDALSELYELKDSAFPGALIEHFIHCIGIFPVGGFVQMNTGAVGIIVSRNRIRQLRPKVMIVVDEGGNRLDTPQTLNLATADGQAGDSTEQYRVARVVDPREFGLTPSEYFA